jgi:integrase
VGGIEKRGSSYRASVRVRGRLQPMRRTFDTKAAAQRWIRQTETDLERGTWRDPDAGTITFDEWTKLWLAARGSLQQRSRDEEASIVKNHLIPAFGKLRLDQISPLVVETFVSGLVQGLAPKTVRNVHGVLHAVLQMAVRDQRITANPCVGTRLPGNERRKVMACLTEQQIGQLVAAVDPHWQPLLTTLAGTGLRWGEAAGLRVKYVDLMVPELSVRETLNPTATRYKTSPKSDAGRRTIGLPATVVDALLPLVAGKGGDEPVFTMPDGSLIKHRFFNYAVWQPACKTVGVSATPHDLRHSHVALLIAANVPLSAISRRIGHASIATTDKVYGYLLPRVEADLLAALDAALVSAAPGEPQLPVAPESTSPAADRTGSPPS